MDYRIVADSSCDLPKDFFKNDGIELSVVPLKIMIDGKEFTDDDTLNIKEFLEAMNNSKTSSTSCPSPQDFAEQFSKNKCSFGITISKMLSGTYNSAILGANMAKEENPEIKAEVVDSLLTSGGMILIAMKIRDYIKEGLCYEEIVEKARAYQKTIGVKFVLQDINHLVKAGRMSRIAGVFASALSICPVLSDNGNGEIKVLSKARGAKMALSQLADTVKEKWQAQKDFPIVITHCDNKEQAGYLKDLIMERFGIKNIQIFEQRGLASYYAAHKGLIMAF